MVRRNARGKTIRCACGAYHHPVDPNVSTPLDPDTYDYSGSVLWQANVGALWSRFAQALRRTLARSVG
ncbi:replication initiator [Lentzea sp. NPDC055074]